MPYVSRALYFWSTTIAMFVGYVLYMFYIPHDIVTNPHSASMPLNIAQIIMGYAGIVLLIFYYKMWKALPPSFARTTPGRAVGFLFIPIFNFYWIFQVYWGWTKDFNNFIRERNLNIQRAPERLALAICIFYAASIVFVLTVGVELLVLKIIKFNSLFNISLLFGIISLVMHAAFIWKVITVLNSVPLDVRQQMEAERQVTPRATKHGYGIASMITGIVAIFMPFGIVILGTFFISLRPIATPVVGVAVLLGILAILFYKDQKKKYGPSGFATAGLVLGIISLTFSVPMLILGGLPSIVQLFLQN